MVEIAFFIVIFGLIILLSSKQGNYDIATIVDKSIEDKQGIFDSSVNKYFLHITFVNKQKQKISYKIQVTSLVYFYFNIGDKITIVV